MIEPTVGRVVLFYPAKSDVSLRGRGPLAAQIAYVHSARCVNLGVLDHNGIPFNATSVTLLQDDDGVPEHGYYAEWMPYQKGQAAKTEQLQALQNATK